MDEDDPLLSHQIQAVNSLANQFDQITVVTGRIGKHEKKSNVQIISTNWIPGRKIQSALTFLGIAIPHIFFGNYSVLFSHMTEVQSSLVAPLTRIRRLRHFLWYAHTTHSKYLRWSHLWVNGIITSTLGSCPIKGRRVFPIGQAVDPRAFPFAPRTDYAFNQAIHIGRFDPSKKIEKIISTGKQILKENPSFKLTLIGSPSTVKAKIESERLLSQFHEDIGKGWLVFLPSVRRSEVPALLASQDFFIHAYEGSLDKTLIEATMSGMPVITLNPEYQSEFGNWGSKNPPTLYSEYLGLSLKSEGDLSAILNSRTDKSKSDHSIDSWINNLVRVLS
jgi:glycosyltransferase involved in cell wall biosynthesis